MRVLVVGYQGMLAQELLPCLQANGHTVINKGLPEIDICDSRAVQCMIDAASPDLVANAAAYTAVDQAEASQEIAFSVNRDGAKHLAQHCREAGVPLIHISTDYVFDGTQTRPYRVEDPTSPLGVYGRSKWEGEEAIRQCHDQHIIVRTAWLHSIFGSNFVKTMLRLANARKDLRVVSDQYGCPTWAKDLARAIVTICNRIGEGDELVEWGTYHFCGAGETTWYDFAKVVIDEGRKYAPLIVEQIEPVPTIAYPTPAQRPQYSVLDCSKISNSFGIQPPYWESSVRHCVEELCLCPTSLPITS